MSTITPPIPVPAQQTLALPAVYRMTVDEYEKLVNAGVLDDPRIELIDGYLVKKMSKNPAHVWSVDVILEFFKATVLGFWCRQEAPVRIPDFDEPEPDVSVVRGARNDYRGRIPGPDDIVLVAEVSESTLDRDRGEKRRAYARVSIPYYWIINLVDRQLEVYSNLSQGEYHSVQVFKSGDEVPVIIDGDEVGRLDVAAVLP
jgi:Uma2 family endonuclease